MARKQETLTFSGALEVQSQKPLDARRKVTLIADLTDAASFPYIYKGLDVFCEENSKWYTFLGGDSTDANNWRMEGTGSGTSDYSALSNKPKINNVELSGNKSFNDLKIRSLDRTEDVKPYGFENYTVFYGSINNAGAWGFAYDSKHKRFVFIDSIMDLSTSSQTQYRLITETGLEEVVAELFKSVNVANSEPFTVAANSYEVGDYVLHKTSAYEPFLLWRVTKAIASGDTIYSTGTNQNIEQVTLGSELKRIEEQGGGTVDAYTKAETDTLLADKADQSTTYTKTETDALIEGEHIELTQAQYTALPEEEKKNGKVYFITDGGAYVPAVDLIPHATQEPIIVGKFDLRGDGEYRNIYRIRRWISDLKNASPIITAGWTEQGVYIRTLRVYGSFTFHDYENTATGWRYIIQQFPIPYYGYAPKEAPSGEKIGLKFYVDHNNKLNMVVDGQSYFNQDDFAQVIIDYIETPIT